MAMQLRNRQRARLTALVKPIPPRTSEDGAFDAEKNTVFGGKRFAHA